MNYIPKRSKFIKLHKKKNLKTLKNIRLIKYIYGIKLMSYSLLTKRQLETLRRFISRRLQKRGKILRRYSLNISLTKKPLNSRMGKGCGNLNIWVGYVYPGTILFEFSGLKNQNSMELEFKKLKYKMPFKCKLIKNPIWYTFNI